MPPQPCLRHYGVLRGEAAGGDLVAQAAGGGVGGGVEVAAQGGGELVPLLEGAGALAGAGVEAHQAGVGLLVGRLGGEGALEGGDCRRPVRGGLVVGGGFEEEGEVEATQAVARGGRPVLVAIIREEFAAVEVEGLLVGGGARLLARPGGGGLEG